MASPRLELQTLSGPIDVDLQGAVNYGDVRQRAAQKLGCGEHQVLMSTESGRKLQNESAFQDGEVVLIHVLPADRTFTNRLGNAEAKLHGDGSVATRGAASNGGDCSSVQSQLIGVRDINSTQYAFAALKEDGSVVAWGDADFGGDCSSVQGQLAGGVQGIRGITSAFAGLREDGVVITWGSQPGTFGASAIDTSQVQGQLAGGVLAIHATDRAFAALKEEGIVVAWGLRDQHEAACRKARKSNIG